MQILITLLLAVMMMAGLFLLLWGGVGFVQNYSFFSSAPKEVRDAVPVTKPERFKGQHFVGWIMIVLAFALMVGAVVIGAVLGVRDNLTFWQLSARFLAMILLVKAFDIGFFDWFLLCNSGFGFFAGFYPECKPVLGRYLFGYNWKTHLAHIIGAFPVSALIAWICTLF